jgi:pyruvate/2-oxoglutarate dehydrogenase complex dihydrolipoamide acyltransferase (E2) component
MDIYSLSRKWKELVDKARAKQLSPQEYTTGFCYHLICVIHGVIHSTVAILLQQ